MQPAPGGLRCEVCGAELASQEELEEHGIQQHEAQVGGYRCPVCHMQFTSRQELDEHSRQEHPPVE